MAKTEKSETGKEVVTGAQNETGVTVATQKKEMLKMFEQVDDSDLIELTSELLKLEEGMQWNGVITREKQTMKSQDEDGEDYEGYVGYDKNLNKVVLSDAVVMGVMDDHFQKFPQVENVLVRVSCKGMRKNSKGREYRDLTVRIAAPKAAN